MAEWIEDDDLATQWHELMGRFHRITCALDRTLSARHSLTASEFEVLQQLREGGDPCGQVRMSELGEHVHLSQSALSRLVTRLEKAGLVERSTCDDDRRSVWTRITEAGLRLYAEARPTQRAVLREQVAREGHGACTGPGGAGADGAGAGAGDEVGAGSADPVGGDPVGKDSTGADPAAAGERISA